MRLAMGGAAAAIAVSGAAPRAWAAEHRRTFSRHIKPLIMLDPGHGGIDPGAIAPDGIFEKHITLSSALELRQELERTGRYRVAMTRVHDVYVALDKRVADAVAQKADLFLSLHCDHLPEANLRGASMFTLSNDATDALAASVAQDENSDDGPTGFMAGAPPQVANILASLETRATKISSLNLAQDLHASFKGLIPMLPDPTRAANFAVLRDPSTPAALLEMGCLTNPLDERRLRNPVQRRQLAERITLAINTYFDNEAQQRMAG
ncbi:N-acetylmuramoyl-L-alanine amidase [Acidocella sp.]|uniref:N-acetylmuramoyl-L-alanine amidase family protein n=1 Tax=Acidocella sp. TaxID=50710 RepID=UPI0026200C06|nr:N-acetylmuramoyl-L-alanine amidase [Acidocella sp.]